jgi:hypothetical protein
MRRGSPPAPGRQAKSSERAVPTCRHERQWHSCYSLAGMLGGQRAEEGSARAPWRVCLRLRFGRLGPEHNAVARTAGLAAVAALPLIAGLSGADYEQPGRDHRRLPRRRARVRDPLPRRPSGLGEQSRTTSSRPRRPLTETSRTAPRPTSPAASPELLCPGTGGRLRARPRWRNAARQSWGWRPGRRRLTPAAGPLPLGATGGARWLAVSGGLSAALELAAQVRSVVPKPDHRDLALVPQRAQGARREGQ